MSLWFDIHEGPGHESKEIHSQNVTHNLAPMWRAAGCYEALYERQGSQVRDVLPVLKAGLTNLLEDPDRYRPLSATNGWGTYEQAVPWLLELIMAIMDHPHAYVRVGR